jgi:ABC-2 type transport system permease protein
MLNLPLLFLSNALYPMNSVPTWLKIGSLLNPTTYVVDGMRRMALENATIGGSEPISLWICFVVIAVFAAAGMNLALRAFRSSLE